MRKSITFAAAIWLGCSLGQAAAEELRIATGEYAPFTNSQADDHGFVNAFVADIADAAGYEATFTYLPWARTLGQTRTAQFDATSFWYHSPDRDADFIHVGPIMTDRLVFFRLRDTEIGNWSTLADLTEHPIGVVPGYTYTPEFWSLGETGVLSLSEGPSDAANFKKLRAGRIDLLPISEAAGWSIIEAEFPADHRILFTVEERPVLVTEGFLLVPRTHPDANNIATRLQDAVENDGALASIATHQAN